MSFYNNQTVYHCGAYEVQLPVCLKNVIIPTSELDTLLMIEITDKFGIIYQQEVQSDLNGFITIDMTLFDDNMYSQYSGEYYLIAYQSGGSNKDPVQFLTDIGYFAKLLIRFVEVRVTNNLYPYNYYVDGLHYVCCCDEKPLCP